MNKRILVSQEEKNSILSMHESFKNRGVIIEQKSLTINQLSDGTAYNATVDKSGNLIITTEDNYSVNAGKSNVPMNSKDGMVVITKDKTGKRVIMGKNSKTVYKTI
jgi:hypothetical protein